MAELVQQRKTITNPVVGATLAVALLGGLAGGAVAIAIPAVIQARADDEAAAGRLSPEVADVRPGVGEAVPPDVPDLRIAIAHGDPTSAERPPGPDDEPGGRSEHQDQGGRKAEPEHRERERR